MRYFLISLMKIFLMGELEMVCWALASFCQFLSDHISKLNNFDPSHNL